MVEKIYFLSLLLGHNFLHRQKEDPNYRKNSANLLNIIFFTLAQNLPVALLEAKKVAFVYGNP